MSGEADSKLTMAYDMKSKRMKVVMNLLEILYFCRISFCSYIDKSTL